MEEGLVRTMNRRTREGLVLSEAGCVDGVTMGRGEVAASLRRLKRQKTESDGTTAP